MSSNDTPVRLGRIGYVNVLPIYHALEAGVLTHDFSFHSGPPAELNQFMSQGGMDLSSCSSIEYGRNPDDYFLIPDLAIASRGPVMSVLLMSQAPVESLSGQQLVLSAQTHTSAALLRLLLCKKGVTPAFITGDVSRSLGSDTPPAAFLAIGDEAMSLRSHPGYPYRWDLGQAWMDLTGLPFVFGVWVASRRSVEKDRARMLGAVATLLRAKAWGQAHLEQMAAMAAGHAGWTETDMLAYFQGLSYDLSPWELSGLNLFYQWLHDAGEIPAVPALRFLEPDTPA